MRKEAIHDEDDAGRGSWESIKHQYDAYRYDRLTAQERDRLAVAFNNEVAATGKGVRFICTDIFALTRMPQTHGFEHQPGELALQFRDYTFHRRIVDTIA
jgi:hypothetical protein